jgi:hypothetical protein
MYGTNERTFTLEVTHLDLDVALVALTGTWMLMCDVELTEAETDRAATLQELHPYLCHAHTNTEIAGQSSTHALELTASDIEALDFALGEVSAATFDPAMVASLRYHLTSAASQQSS